MEFLGIFLSRKRHGKKKETLTIFRKCLVFSERKTGLKPATPSLEG